jgi:hypothetical protein
MNKTASRTAEQTVYAPQLASGILQRKCACDQHTIAGGECTECSNNRRSLQRATRDSELGTPDSFGVPPIVSDVLRSPGQPLDSPTRAFFEPRFGHDFSQVRVHTDGRAAASARAVNALAYTVGRDVVFLEGQYRPETIAGRSMLAHELTHVAQQAVGVRALSTGEPDDAYESEADRMVRSILKGEQTEIRQQKIPERLQRLQAPPSPLSLSNPCPTSVRIGAVRQFNHGNISPDNQEKYRTYLSNISTMNVGPGPDHTGHYMQELLITVSNNCPAKLTKASAPCSGHDPLPINKPTSFVDGHVTKSAQSFLEGTGVNSCSVVCEQRYFCDSLIGPKATGVFRITRNYQAGTYKNLGGNIVHITTGTVEKTEVPGRPAPSPGFPKAPPLPLQDAPERTLPEGMALV